MMNLRRVVGLVWMAYTAVGLAQGRVAGMVNYERERVAQAKELTRPYDWFSLIALDWLKPGITTVGSASDNSYVLAGAPAHLLTIEEKDGRLVLLAADATLRLGGRRVDVGARPEIGDGEDDGSAMESGTLRMWAIDRGGKRYLRVKDSNAPALKHFHGLRWFPPDARYRVEARWIPYATPHVLKVLNKLGQTTETPVPGYVEFRLEGKTVTLVPMSATDQGLFFVFRDLTSQRMTDGGGRFLTTDGPSHGVGKPGAVVLDFNEAGNPPCAYSPYATCPLASPENRLPVAVRAGEKRYED